MKVTPSQLAEVLISEGVDPVVVKKVLMNLGFSNDDAMKVMARVYAIADKKFDERKHQDNSQLVEMVKRHDLTISKLAKDVEDIKNSLKLSSREGRESIELQVLAIEEKLNTLVDLLSEYVSVIVEKVGRRK